MRQVDAARRESFLNRLTDIVEAAEITFAAAIIDKRKLGERYANPWSPYDLAVTFCMEKTAKVLRANGENETEVNVVFEARGRQEDQHLELEFRRVASGSPRLGKPSAAVTAFTWSPMFVDKRANSTGLQFADLAARPLGLNYLRPNQSNRAVSVLMQKLAYPHPKVFP